MKILGFNSATAILFPGNANLVGFFCLQQQKITLFRRGLFSNLVSMGFRVWGEEKMIKQELIPAGCFWETCNFQ